MSIKSRPADAGRWFIVALVAFASLAWAAPAGATLLYDQASAPVSNGIYSTETGSTQDSEAADDFTVPDGQEWTIESVAAPGQLGTPSQVRVRLFAAAGTLPGAELYSTVATTTFASTDVVVALDAAPLLLPGHYWVSVQAINPNDTWYFDTRSDQLGDPAVWRNPQNGFRSGCTDFRPLGTECVPDADIRDLMFSLSGTEIPTLRVTRAGSGSGTVTSEPDGIDCGTDCTEIYEDPTEVTLTATAAEGSTFAGFAGGGCSGTDPCTVTMDQSRAVTATFTFPQQTLTAAIDDTGTGTGTVTGTGINCPGDCTQDYDEGSSVELTATAAEGSDFVTWTGGGCGTAATCTVTMDAAKTVTATFAATQQAQQTLTAAIDDAGTGTGTVTGTGIDCPGDCTQDYDEGSSVELTATPAADSDFVAWSGCDEVEERLAEVTTCTVTMSAANTVTATFTLKTGTVNVETLGDGGGTVTDDGIACPGDCTENADYGSVFTLSATPDGDSTFAGWTGCDDVRGKRLAAEPTCTVTIEGVRDVTATFDPVASSERSLRVTTTGAGSGFVDSAPEGINCGNNLVNGHDDCVQEYSEPQIVTLTAHTSRGSTFGGFDGDCQVEENLDAVDTTCRVAVDAAKSVSARFVPTGGGGGGGGTVPDQPGPPAPGAGGNSGGTTVPVGPTAALSARDRRSITVMVDPGTAASTVTLTGRLRIHGHRAGDLAPLSQGLAAGTPVTLQLRITRALRREIRAARKAGKTVKFKLTAVFTAADGTITVRRISVNL